MIGFEIISIKEFSCWNLHKVRDINPGISLGTNLLLFDSCHCCFVFRSSKSLLKVIECLTIKCLHSFKRFYCIRLIIIMHPTSLIDLLKSIFQIFILKHWRVFRFHIHLSWFSKNASVIISMICQVKIMRFSSLSEFVFLMLPQNLGNVEIFFFICPWKFMLLP